MLNTSTTIMGSSHLKYQPDSRLGQQQVWFIRGLVININDSFQMNSIFV